MLLETSIRLLIIVMVKYSYIIYEELRLLVLKNRKRKGIGVVDGLFLHSTYNIVLGDLRDKLYSQKRIFSRVFSLHREVEMAVRRTSSLGRRR